MRQQQPRRQRASNFRRTPWTKMTFQLLLILLALSGLTASPVGCLMRSGMRLSVRVGSSANVFSVSKSKALGPKAKPRPLRSETKPEVEAAAVIHQTKDDAGGDVINGFMGVI